MNRGRGSSFTGVIFLALLAFLAYLSSPAFGQQTHHVPDVLGKDASDALNALHKAGFRKIEVTREPPTAGDPPGVVYDIDYRPPVHPDTPIALKAWDTVDPDTGRPTAPFPDLRGYDSAGAEKEVSRLGYRPSVRYIRNSGGHEADHVAAVVYRRPLRRGELIILEVWDGEGLDPAPHVVGKSEAEALNALSRAGYMKIDVEERRPPSDDDPAGTVFYQKLSPADKSAVLKAWDSRFPPGSRPVILPDLRREDERVAAAAVKKLGLVPSVKAIENPGGHQAGTVAALLYQDPLQKGDMVVLEVWELEGTTPIPYVVGKPEKEALNILHRAGFTNTHVQREVSPDESSAGRVYGQEAEAGSSRSGRVSIKAWLTLDDAGSLQDPLPDLRGRHEDEALRELRDLGYFPTVKYLQNFGSHAAKAVAALDYRQPLRKGDPVTVEVWAGSDGRIPVPYVVGKPEREALNALHGAGFANVYVERTPPSPGDVPGQVYDMVTVESPGTLQTGGGADFNSEIRLKAWLRLDPETGSLLDPFPDVMGKSYEEAEKILRQEGYRTTVRFVPNSSGSPVGIVSALDYPRPPGKGDLVVIKAWGDPEGRPVPDVVGRQEEEALNILYRAGFRNVRTERNPSGAGAAPGEVYDMRYELHSDRDAEILLWAYTDPERDDLSDVDLPNLRGKGEDEARDVLLGLGVQARVRYIPNDGGQSAGTVASVSSPKPLTQGDTVHLEVWNRYGDVTVPDLVGAPKDKALRELYGLDLGVKVKEVIFDPRQEMPPDHPENHVIDMAYDSPMHQGDTVTITVWREGKKPGPVPPDVIGLGEKEAVKRVRDAGYKPAVTYVEKARGKKGAARERSRGPGGIGGAVVSDATYGIPLSKGDQITLVIELAADEVLVPDLAGLSEDEARARLADKGLKVIVEYEPGGSGTGVIGQGPKAGSPVPSGSAVRITVSRQDVPVPDLSGKTREEAESALKDIGLAADFRDAGVHDSSRPAGAVVSQSPAPGEKAVTGSPVTVQLNPPPRPSMGMKVSPGPPYGVGDKILFTENVRGRNPAYTYTFTWFVDGVEAAKGPKFTHLFSKPGPHYVQLVMTCKEDPSENDAIIRNIGVEYPPDPVVRITVEMKKGTCYNPGDLVKFKANTSHLLDATEYRWYVDDEPIESGDYIGSGREQTFVAGNKKKYFVRLGVRRGSNFDEIEEETTIVNCTDPDQIKPLGRWRNRFRASGSTANLKVCSSYWKMGYAYLGVGGMKSGKAEWSKCTDFDTVGAVENYDLYTGEQSGGHNSGWLAYVPGGKKEIRYRVYGFHFETPPLSGYQSYRGFTRYHGKLAFQGTPIPGSIAWVEKKPRAGKLQWGTEEGKQCSAWIYGTKGSSTLGSITQKFFVKGGVQGLACEDAPPGGYTAGDDPGMGTGSSPSSITNANQIGSQIHGGSGGTTPGAGGGSSQGNLSNVTVSQQDVKITFWDHRKEDGDVINIFLNGTLLKGGINLKNKKQSFDVKLKSGTNTFEVEAVNEGSDPPNTASVRISHVTQGRGTQIYQRKSGQRASMNLLAP